MEGSKTITTDVTVSELLAQMEDHSYYIGEALKSDPVLIELAAKLQASKDDTPVLRDFIRSGVATVSNLLTRVLGITSYKWTELEPVKVTFTTKAVINFPTGQETALKDSIINYLSCFSLSGWLKLVKPNEADRFDVMCAEYEKQITHLSAQRSKPVRK